MEDLVKAFLNGQCSDEELKQLQAWLSKPENKEEAEALFRKTWKESAADRLKAEFDKEEVWKGILEKAKIPQAPKVQQRRIADREPYRLQRRRGLPAGLKIILGLMIVLAISYLALVKPPDVQSDQLSSITKEAPRGFRNKVTLADGSLAILNSESSIEYAADYGKESRTIHLKGEAFFEVTHNPEIPFVVMANGVKTTALGTSFNINAYQPKAQTISLATGKVIVETAHSEADGELSVQMLLAPGEQAVWSGEETSLTKRPYDRDLVLSWKDNVIYFRNTDLKHMINVLEKWYDVQITINGNLDQLMQTGTGTFKDESLENVLNSLSFSMGFEYEMKKDKVTLNLTD